MTAYPHLRKPIAIGRLTARNRLMMTTHGPRLSQARYVRYLEERAEGGIGLAGFNLGPMGLMQFPLGPGRPFLPQAGDFDSVPPHPLSAEGKAYYDGMIPAMRELRDAVARHGTLAVGQLYHPGAAQHSDNFQPVIGPSPTRDQYEHHNTHALSVEEIAGLVETYGLAARRAVQAGFDIIELHAAHGYIGHQFLSPLINVREDQYGGSLENRLRFLMETITAVRAAVDDKVPVGLRLNGPDPVEGGLTLAEVVEVSRRVEAAGMAYVSLSGGTYSGLLRGAHLPYVAPAFIPRGPNVPVAAAVKKAVRVPVLVTGRINDIDLAERVVAEGKADMIGMVRALIADPRLPAKAFAGKGERIAPCIACMECHYGRPVTCTVNAAAGREAAMQPIPAPVGRHILVVGAGPAGVECALAAARRGHHVTLADRRAEAGGLVTALARGSEQAEFGAWLDYIRGALKDSSVELKLGTEVDEAFVDWLHPDVVVLATGARQPAGGPGVFTGAEALEAPDRLGRRVVVAGGLDDHLPPLVLADLLARSGRQVTLLSENGAPGLGVEPAGLNILLRRLSERGVVMRPLTAAGALEGGRLALRNSLTGAPDSLDGVDSLVVADGRLAEDALASRLKARGTPIHVIGDALSPRRMLHASLDGARLGTQGL
jgi:2,4-dienoyl-CoA reductase-like NADH-dependent reductase (Old Yellow Enzyme family)